MKDGNPDELDILLQIERMMAEINRKMSYPSKIALKRYPITFALLGLFGVVAVSEGIKGFLEKVTFLQDEPLYLLMLGLFILITLGILYKKLDK